MKNPKNLFERAWQNYNPENDIPDGVQVTFDDLYRQIIQNEKDLHSTKGFRYGHRIHSRRRNR
jgi:hypothetical protein